MENNTPNNQNPSLSELKASTPKLPPQGEKINEEPDKTVGGDWLNRMTENSSVPTPEETYTVTPGANQSITTNSSVAPEITEAKGMPTQVPVAPQQPAIPVEETPSVPQLPPEETPVPKYDGPGLIVNKEDLEEKPKEMQAPGTPLNLDDTLNSYLAEYDERIEHAKEVYEENVAKAPVKEEDVETEETSEDPEEFNRKYEEAIVVIDKMGMGTTIEFSEEERKKLEYAKKITLQEVQTKELKTIKTKKMVSGKNKGVKIDSIIQRRQVLHSTSIVLIASGYTAVMKGCTPYELMEIVNENKNEVINQETRWALIYRKIEETSIGKPSFNQFLEITAATDYATFIFGILCATYPDNDKFPLKCQTEGCGREFDHHYSVKSLIRAEKMSEGLKNRFIETVDASHIKETAEEVHGNSPVMDIKRIELPMSGFILDVSIQSAHDYIYKSIKELSSENTEAKYQQAAITSSIVRKLYIRDADSDEYFEFDQPKDITKAVYSLDAIDLKILYKQVQDLFKDTAFEFGLMNVNCPHCRTVTNTVPIDVENVLFYRYRQELSTTIE